MAIQHVQSFFNPVGSDPVFDRVTVTDVERIISRPGAEPEEDPDE